MDKQNVIQIYNEILFRLKREEILQHVTMWMNLEDIMLSEISQSKILHDSIYMRYLTQANS